MPTSPDTKLSDDVAYGTHEPGYAHQPRGESLIVTMDDIGRAFRSSDYASSRFEIEKLNRQLNSGRSLSAERDLYSPLDPVDGLIEHSDSLQAMAELKRRERALVEHSAQEAAMPGDQRVAATKVKHIEEQGGYLAARSTPKRPRPPKRQPGDLASGQTLFEKLF